MADCLPVVDGYKVDEFIAATFSDCVYTPKDYASFVIGMSSILCWMVAQLPQIYKNWRNGRADALSLGFLLEWLAGDVTNLLGCILDRQLPTQTFTAMYFVFIDMILFTQYLYYQLNCKRDSSASVEYKPVKGVPRRSTQETDQLLGAKKGSLGSTDREYGSSGTSPGRNTRRSPSLDDASVNGGDATGPGNAKVLMVALCVGLCMAQGLGAMGSKSVHTVGGVSGLQQQQQQQIGAAGTGRVLTEFPYLPKGEDNAKLQEVGKFIGYVSAMFYLLSRMPQIYRNYKRKSTEGLAILMFVMAVLGNTTYALGIVLRSIEPDYILGKLPWLLGSVGTLLFDFTVFLQFQWYKKKGTQGIYEVVDTDSDMSLDSSEDAEEEWARTV